MRSLSRFCIALAVIAFQPDLSAATDRLSTELLEKTGAIEGVKSMPEALRAQLEASRAQGMEIDSEFLNAWNSATAKSFEVAKIVPAMATVLTELMSESDRRELIAFYDRPFAQRIVQLEVEAARPEKTADVSAYAQTRGGDPEKYASRLKLYKQLDEAIDFTGLLVNYSVKTSIAIQTGMLASGKLPFQMTYEEVKAAVEQQRPAITQQVSSFIYGYMSYCYRDVSDKDMASYIAFLESALAKKFFASYERALDTALGEANRNFGREVAEGLGRKPI